MALARPLLPLPLDPPAATAAAGGSRGKSPRRMTPSSLILPCLLAGIMCMCFRAIGGCTPAVSQVRVTVRSGVPPTAEEPEAVGVAGAAQRQMAQAGAEQQQQQQPQPAGSGRQYAFLLALSNHKTGTFQLDCLTRAIAQATQQPVIWRPEEIFTEEVGAHLVWQRQARSGRPVMVSAGHAPNQLCYRRGRRPYSVGPSCPNYRLPCAPDGTPMLSLNGCFLNLPGTHLGAPGMAHFYRNPLDIVTSALWYHTQDPIPHIETWLRYPAGSTLDAMVSHGVPREELQALGLSSQELRSLSFAALLRSLPEEKAVQLQFWNSVPELYTMARQYRILKQLPGAVQIRFEDAQRDLLGAIAPLLAEFFPNDTQAISENVRRFKCDPASWSAEEVARSNHVTAAKHPPGSKERLQRVLWEQPRIWRHLCALAQALEYELPLPCPPAGGEAAVIAPGSGAGVGQQVQMQQRSGQQQQQGERAQQQRIMDFMQRKAQLGEQRQQPQAEQHALAEQQAQRQQALAEQQALMEQQQQQDQSPLAQQAEQQDQGPLAQQAAQQAQAQPMQEQPAQHVVQDQPAQEHPVQQAEPQAQEQAQEQTAQQLAGGVEQQQAQQNASAQLTTV